MWFGNQEYSRSKGSYLLAGLCLSESSVRWLEVTARGNITSGFWQPCADTRYPQPNHWSLSCGIHKISSKCTSACLKTLERAWNVAYGLRLVILLAGLVLFIKESDVQISANVLLVSRLAVALRYNDMTLSLSSSLKWPYKRALSRGYNIQLSYSAAASHQLTKSLVEGGFDHTFMLVQLR